MSKLSFEINHASLLKFAAPIDRCSNSAEFSSTIGGITNLVLDYIFMFEMGMGIESAGIASGIGNGAVDERDDRRAQQYHDVVGVFVEEGSPVHVLTVQGFKLFAFSFLFAGFNVYSSSMFTALNDGRISAVLSFCHTMVFLIGMLMLLPKVMGLRGVWLASPTAEFLSMLMSFAVFRWKAATYRY